MSLTKASYSMITGAPVNVLDYGATGDGVTDDTAAFYLAIATGRKVYVTIPSGAGYVVNNIAVVDNMVIEGEKSGISGGASGPALIVTQNNAGAFLHPNATDRFQIQISNFIGMTSQSATVTGASFYKQPGTGNYCAYARFENIETYADFLVSFTGFFIFAQWVNCRDGYVGNAQAQGHGFISSVPASYTQGNQTNICSLRDTYVFRSAAGTSATLAAVVIAYGNSWMFERCDFENLATPAVDARGIYGVNFVSTWFERIAAAYCVNITTSPSPAIGTRPVKFTECFANLSSTTSYFISVGGASYANFDNCVFIQVPSGVTLANSATAIAGALNTVVASGVGSASFLTGYNTTSYTSGKMMLNGAVDTGTSSPVQLDGIFTSSGGVTALPTQVVTATPVAIATALHGAQLIFVKITNNSGGNGGWYLLAVTSSNSNITTISSYTAVLGITPTFTAAGGTLSISFAVGSGTVSTALLV